MKNTKKSSLRSVRMRDVSATSQVNSGVNLTAITQSSSNVTCSSFENFEGKNHSGIYNKNRPPLFKCGYLIDANFQGAIFDSPADFRGAILTNANFKGAIFNSPADFTGAKLTNADFTSAFLNSPKFKGAQDFGSANFQGAILDNYTDICPPGAICNSPPPPTQWKQFLTQLLAQWQTEWPEYLKQILMQLLAQPDRTVLMQLMQLLEQWQTKWPEGLKQFLTLLLAQWQTEWPEDLKQFLMKLLVLQLDI